MDGKLRLALHANRETGGRLIVPRPAVPAVTRRAPVSEADGADGRR